MQLRKCFALLAVAVVGVFSFAATGTATSEVHKVIVCKYVGTPGVDERLQTGDNPIQVDHHAIPGFDGTFPYEFADAQGRSMAIRWAANNQDRGDISECPVPENPPVEPPVVVPPVEPPVVTPPGPPCPITPGNPDGSLPDPPGGKDGNPGNDECIPDEVVPPVTVPPVATTPTETTETETTETETETTEIVVEADVEIETSSTPTVTKEKEKGTKDSSKPDTAPQAAPYTP